MQYKNRALQRYDLNQATTKQILRNFTEMRKTIVSCRCFVGKTSRELTDVNKTSPAFHPLVEITEFVYIYIRNLIVHAEVFQHLFVVPAVRMCKRVFVDNLPECLIGYIVYKFGCPAAKLHVS